MAKVQQRRRDVLVGLFVLAALSAGLFLVAILGSEQGIFRPRFELRAVFVNVNGLRAGAPVFVAGPNVGSVRSIRFSEPDELARAQEGMAASLVEVVLDVEARYATQIRADSRASVGSVGLLGDKSIEITVGRLDSPELLDGESIETEEPVGLTDMMSQVQPMAENLDQILADLAVVTGSLSTPESPLMQAIESLSSVLDKVDSGKGTAGAILNSEKMAGKISRILDEASSLLVESTAAVEEVRIAAEQLPATMDSVRAVSADVEALANALREGAGRVPEISANLAEAAVNLREASESLPSIAATANVGVRQATEVVDAASRTIFLRGQMEPEVVRVPQAVGQEFPLPEAAR